MATNNSPYINSVKYLNNVKYMPNVYTPPNVGRLQNVAPISFGGLTYYTPQNYNDTGEMANSLADVLLSKDSTDNLLEDYGWGDLKDVPILNKLAGITALEKKNYADPVLAMIRGEQTPLDTGKDIFFNSLTEISEDLDVFSNMVKSQMPAAGGGFSSENFKASIGWDQPRKTFNYNTGNVALDILLETISDPITWVTAGLAAAETVGKAGATKATEVAVKEVAKNAAKDASKELSEEALNNFAKAYVKALNKEVAKTMQKEGIKVATKELYRKAAQRMTYTQVVQYMSKEAAKAMVATTAKEAIINNVLKNGKVLNKVGYKEYLKAIEFRSKFRYAQSTAQNAVRWVTPIGPAKYGVKAFVQSDAVKAIKNHIVNKMKTYNKEDLLNKYAGDTIEDILEDTVDENKKYDEFIKINNQAYEKLYNNPNTRMKFTSLGLNKDSVQNMIYNILVDDPKSVNKLTEKEITDLFWNKYNSIINDLAGKKETKFVQEAVGIYKPFTVRRIANPMVVPKNNIFKLNPKVEKELNNVILEAAKGPVAYISLLSDQLATGQDIVAKNFINTLKNTVQNDSIDLKKNIQVLDKMIMHNGVYYGLDNLEGYFQALSVDPTVTEKEMKMLEQLFKAYGITTDTAETVKYIINNVNTDEAKEYIKLLKTVYKETDPDIANKMDAIINSINNNKLNKIYTDNAMPHKKAITYRTAVKNIVKNKDVDNMVKLVKDTVALQEYPELETVNKNIERARSYFNEKIGGYNSAIKEIYDEVKSRPGVKSKHEEEALKKLKDGVRRYEFLNRQLKVVEERTKTIAEYTKKITSDNVLPSDIINYWQIINNAKSKLTYANKILIGGGAYAVQLNADIERYLNVLNKLTSESFKYDLSNYVEITQDKMVTQLSYLGAYDIMYQATRLSENEEVRKTMEELSNKNSVLRKEVIPRFIEVLEQSDQPVTAQNMYKLLAEIDTTNNLAALRTRSYLGKYKLDKKTTEIINRMVYDVVYNNRTMPLADILDETSIKELTYNEFEELSKLIGEDKEALLEYYRTRTNKQYLFDYLNQRLDRNKTYILSHVDNIVDPDELFKDIKQSAQLSLKLYLNDQKDIINYFDRVALSTLYSEETVSLLNFSNNLLYLISEYADVDTNDIQNINLLLKKMEIVQEGIENARTVLQDKGIEVQNILTKQAMDNIIRESGERLNIFTASVESGLYATRYMIPENFDINKFKLRPEYFPGTNAEYLLLTQKLGSYSNVLHDPYKYEEEYLEKIKHCLIKTYEQEDILFKPTANPKIYFNTLDAQELLSWEAVTKSDLSINNKTRFYDYLNKFTQIKDLEKISTDKVYEHIDSIVRDAPFVDDDAIGYVATISHDAQATEYANKRIEANFRQSLHSLEDMKEYRDDYEKYIDQDVAALYDVNKTIDDIVNDKDIIEDHVISTEEMHKLYKMDYGYEEGLQAYQTQIYADRKSMAALSIAQSTPEQIATHIYKEGADALVFHNDKIKLVMHKDGSVTWESLDNIFNFSDKELKDAGLMMTKETLDTGDWYYFRLIDNREHNTDVKWIYKSNIAGSAQYRYTHLIDKYRDRLNMTDNTVPSDLLTAETLNRDTWNAFVEAHADFFGDAEERKLYQKLTPQGNSTYFNKSFERLNLTVFGGYNTYNIWNSTYSDTYLPRSIQMDRNTKSGLIAMINRSNKITKYISLIFNDDYSLKESILLRNMFDNASDKEIKNFFKDGKYKVAVLRADATNLPKIYSFEVYNKHSLDAAKAAGGILVPRETFNAMRQVVNKRIMSNDVFSMYKRLVPTTYKNMYLFTAGFPFRNAIDSLLYKNINEEGVGVLKYYIPASKALELHDKIQKEVLDLATEEMQGETFNKELLMKVLENYTREEADVYFLVDLFRHSGASGSLSNSLGDYIERYNKIGVDDIRPIWEQVYEDKILYGKQWYNPLYQLRNLNDNIEQTARMGLFLASVDKGLPIPDALDRVIKTHFDYNSNGDLMEICERIFWFSTFPINNFSYYINEGLTKNPTLFKLALDTQTASWNNGEYTYEQCKKSKFLTYHAMAGNIRIGNWVIKTSPSVFDFFGLVFNPYENIKDRLNPFITFALNPQETDLEELNPLQTQFRNWEKFKQGNPVPSILSKIEPQSWVKRYRQYNKYYKQSSGWTKYPKIKKGKLYKTYAHKYFSRRYYRLPRNLSSTYLTDHNISRHYKIGKYSATYYNR